jgi:hypothetical protein
MKKNRTVYNAGIDDTEVSRLRESHFEQTLTAKLDSEDIVVTVQHGLHHRSKFRTASERYNLTKPSPRADGLSRASKICRVTTLSTFAWALKPGMLQLFFQSGRCTLSPPSLELISGSTARWCT